MATLVGISQEIYEAAGIDGAGRWKKMWYITMPRILANMIITVIILNLAKVLNLFESVFVLQNDAVMERQSYSDIRLQPDLQQRRYPELRHPLAVGLFKSLVGCVLVLICNYISKKVRNGRGIV